MKQTDDIWEDPDSKAIEWFILLEEYPDDGELREKIQAWCQENPAHKQAWQDCQHTSFLLQQGNNQDLFSDPEQNSPQFEVPVEITRQKGGSWRVWSMLAFTVVLLLSVGNFLFQPATIWLYADHKTGIAENSSRKLADGSILHLAADSAVDIEFTERQRTVRLLSGEAFFQVAPNSKRPFVVLAGDTQTRALGTAFNVSLFEDDVYVGVTHGRVRLSGKTGQNGIDLKINDVGVLHADGKSSRKKADKAFITAWRNGKMLIDNQRLGPVIDRLDRYSSDKILVLDPRLKKQRITGVFDLTKTESSLQSIASSIGIKIYHIANITVLSPL